MPRQEFWLKKFKNAGALWEYSGEGPHAALETEPMHAGLYLNADIIAGLPNLVHSICINEFYPLFGARKKVDRVLTFTRSIAGSRALATQLARMLRASAGHADIQAGQIYPAIRKDQKVVLITDEIISTGALGGAMDLVREKEGRLAGPVCALANFSGLDVFEEIPIRAIINGPAPLWPQKQCPLCGQNSAPLPARKGWHSLMGEKF